MNNNYFFSSLTRLSDLQASNFSLQKLPKHQWNAGDFVVGEINPDPSRLPVELVNGRMVELAEGDLLVGAFGTRYATLEATGTWEEIGEDLQMNALTGAGLFGKCVSRSTLLPSLLSMTYRGHVHIDGKKVGMRHYVKPVPYRPFHLPVILITGTSMSAGKTMVARILIRQLKKAGLKVIGAKLTGAGRYRDILSMQDAGADYICDFVEAGLPSTICEEEIFQPAVEHLCSLMAGQEADIAVVEVGASPLEPYNGTAAINALKENIKFIALCSSDPYAVVGVMTAFNIVPDLVAGITTSTEAGIALVEKLTGLKALNVLNKNTEPELKALLKSSLSGLFHPA